MAERLTDERLAEIGRHLDESRRSIDTGTDRGRDWLYQYHSDVAPLLRSHDALTATLDEYRKQFAEDQGRINRLRGLLGEARASLKESTAGYWCGREDCDHCDPHGSGERRAKVLAKLAEEGL